MIKSINAWAFRPDRSPGDIFQIARANGFEGVELTIAESGPFSLAATRDECERVRAAADEHGVKIVSLANGLGWSSPITAEDAAVRRKGIEQTETVLQIANWLGTDAILLVPGGVHAGFIEGFPRTRYDVAYHRAQEGIQQMKRAAERHGATIAVENVWNMFLLSPLEMKAFIDSFDTSRVGSYFDVGNVILTGFPEDWIDILGSRISRVHLKDFKREVGTLAGFCDLLQGDVDFPAVMAALRRVGYDGPLTAEFFDCEDDLPKISAAIDQILEM